MLEIIGLTLAGIIIIADLVLAAEKFVDHYRAEEIRKRGERGNLHSPAWADTMLYWRTEAEEW